MGWFTFLLRDFARPFIPFKFPGKRIKGFNFEGRPHQMAAGVKRFLDSGDAIYACELARLSKELIDASNGALIRRLECIYDEILIDEVQDLNGYDWEIIDALLNSSIEVRMVGDIRQSILSTNQRSAKNKKYQKVKAIHWFREQESKGILEIIENATTRRCHPDVAAFSDTIFDSSWSFPSTISINKTSTEHDGVFLIRSEYVSEYVAKYSPQCLRHSISSGKVFNLNYMNFGVSKGQAFMRVLIIPTQNIVKFIQRGEYLEPSAAASFYVAVTRAKQSVAIVMEKAGVSSIPFWEPN